MIEHLPVVWFAFALGFMIGLLVGLAFAATPKKEPVPKPQGKILPPRGASGVLPAPPVRIEITHIHAERKQ